ncbi:MAG: ammonium transporter [Nitrospirae bacterium]|nr:MAG: ammonium transporter [Nitrospirota bacterium]
MPETHPKVWLLISTTLLMLTLPGVALFYGGMVRKKNVLNTMGLPFLALVLVSLAWLVGGDLLAIVPEAGGERSGTAPLLLVYQMMGGALALSLIAGALVERIRVSFFLLFGLLWSLLVYSPIAQWMWGGWLAHLGGLDYAGGAVLHISAGVSALVAAIMIGPRKGFGRTEMKPNNLPLSVCGAAFLLVGWCGFSAGTGLAPMATVTGAFVTIQAAAAASALAWTAVEWLQRDKPTLLGTISGVVAGLVAISPAAGYVGPLSAIVIGIGAGGLCYMVVNFVKPILGYDDSLDVFGMHAVGGTWGMVATGLFASTAANPDGSDGLFYGYPYQFFVQVVAVLIVWAYAGLMTFLLVKSLALALQPRVEGEAEIMGMDLAQHGERGYS